jgi:hypothetical protein
MYDQVRKDFINALAVLDEEGGYIFLHDTAPPDAEWIGPTRCGTVYKLRREIEQSGNFDIFTFRNSAWGVGLSIVRLRVNGYDGD